MTLLLVPALKGMDRGTYSESEIKKKFSNIEQGFKKQEEIIEKKEKSVRLFYSEKKTLDTEVEKLEKLKRQIEALPMFIIQKKRTSFSALGGVIVSTHPEYKHGNKTKKAKNLKNKIETLIDIANYRSKKHRFSGRKENIDCIITTQQ